MADSLETMALAPSTTEDTNVLRHDNPTESRMLIFRYFKRSPPHMRVHNVFPSPLARLRPYAFSFSIEGADSNMVLKKRNPSDLFQTWDDLLHVHTMDSQNCMSLDYILCNALNSNDLDSLNSAAVETLNIVISEALLLDKKNQASATAQLLHLSKQLSSVVLLWWCHSHKITVPATHGKEQLQIGKGNPFSKILQKFAEKSNHPHSVDMSRTQTLLGHSLHQQITFYLHSADLGTSTHDAKTRRSLLHDNIVPKPDLALELGKSISLTKAEEEAVAREVHATHARIMSESEPEPIQRRQSEFDGRTKFLEKQTKKIWTKDWGLSLSIDEQWFDLSVDLLRKALAITPVIPAHPFELPPSGNAVIDFVNELGYPEPVEIVSNIRQKQYHSTPDSAVHHTGDDFILGNLKLSQKVRTDEVILRKPHKKVQREQPATKRALPKKEPTQTTNPKKESLLPLVDEDDEAQQESVPQEEGDDPDLELAKKMILDAHQEKGEGEVGKGKAIITEEQVAHSLIDLSKKKRNTDQFILVRRDQAPHDSTTGSSSQPEDDTSEKVIHESSSTSDLERTSIQNQESEKSPKEIIRIKREQGEEKQDSTN
ncbi:hypothetical protein Tco_0292130 [Tanacetum coccineum]